MNTTPQSQLDKAIHALKTDSGFSLMNDVPLMSGALDEINHRLIALETKNKANKT